MLSVIVCSHNPREDYLSRVLSALASQTLPRENWELLIIDNASEIPLVERFDISWHPNGRHILEPNLGNIHARLRGIAESKENLLVFVDDDNVLNLNYLEEAIKISREYMFLGAWGGQSIGEYEIKPPVWIEQDAWRLAVRPLTADFWSNDPNHWASRPFGAGLCFRRSVAELFATSVSNDPRKKYLGRRGKLGKLGKPGKQIVIGGEEDHELVENCGTLTLGWGTFRRLQLTHLISADRLNETYFRKLIRAQTASKLYREYLVNGQKTPAHRTSTFIDVLRIVKAFSFGGIRRALFKSSELAGRADAFELLKQANQNGVGDIKKSNQKLERQ